MSRALVLAACAVVLLHAGSALGAAGPGPIDARAWAVLDPADDAVIGSSAGRRQLPIASATKIMTALVVLDRLDPDEQVLVSGYEPGSPLESVVNLEAGDSLSVEDMLYALLLASANDAAVELARATSRTVDEFVRLMNRKARRLGLKDTRFTNPIGLDDPGSHSSAEDLARMAAELRDNPLAARIVDTEAKVLRSGLDPIEVESRNTLLDRAPWIDGVKTGQTLGAGAVLVASGTRKAGSLIAVVLGASGEGARDDSALRLLRWGFRRFGERTVIRRGALAGEADVKHDESALELRAGRELTLAIRKDLEVETRLQAPAEVEGPIGAGERIGSFVAFAGDRRLGAVPVVAARAVAAPSLADRVSPALAIALIAGGLLVIMAGVVGVRIRRGEETSA